MTYATLDRSQNTWGVRVPYGQGSYTVHYSDEEEALEVMESLNRAYVAGWNAALRAAEKDRKNGNSNCWNSLQG